MNTHELFINYLSVKLKVKDYGKEAKSIGDCGEDCSSCTHSIPDRIGNDQLHEAPVKSSKVKRFKSSRERGGSEWRPPLLLLLRMGHKRESISSFITNKSKIFANFVFYKR